jgi:hypothetical protein
MEGNVSFNRREFLGGGISLLALAKMCAAQSGPSYFKGSIPDGLGVAEGLPVS